MREKIRAFDVYLYFLVLVVCGLLIVIFSPPKIFFKRTILVTLITYFNVLGKHDKSIIANLFLPLFTSLLIMANLLKTTGDAIFCENIFAIYKIPRLEMESTGYLCFLMVTMLIIIICLLWLSLEMRKHCKEIRKFEELKDEKERIFFLHDDDYLILFLGLMIAAIIFVAIGRPLFYAVKNNTLELGYLQDYFLLSVQNGLLNLLPILAFFGARLVCTNSHIYSEHGYLLTEDNKVIRYIEKNKKIYVPKKIDICFTDVFENCDSDYEIRFEEGTEEIKPMKFKKSIPDIYFPSTLESISEYSLYIKGQNPYDSSKTIETLLKNPVFKVIDGCMVNTKTKTLLFMVDHTNREIKIPNEVERIGRYAFDDLLLAKTYCQYNKIETDTNWTDRIKRFSHFSNGNGKEYSLYAAETVMKRTQLEKIFLNKKLTFIHPDSFELATGLKEVYIPEGSEFDLAELNPSKPYIKYLGKGKKITHRMIERLLYIHNKIKSGCYPNSKQLAYDLETSEPTINRDIEYLRDTRGAPIQYDFTNRGYFYSEEYELFFDK